MLINAEVIVKKAFGQLVHPVRLWDFFFVAPLAGAGFHAFHFGQGSLADGGVFGTMPFGEFLYQIRALQHDAATRVFGGGLAEILEEAGLCEDIEEIAICADVFGGKLDDRAGLQATSGSDMMADTGGHGAEGLPVVVIVGIHDRDGHLAAHLGDEAPDLGDLIGCQRQLFIDLRADGTVGVIPGVVDAHIDELLQPVTREEVIDIALAKAGGDSGEELRIQAVAQTAESAVQHVFAAPSLVADGASALDAH